MSRTVTSEARKAGVEVAAQDQLQASAAKVVQSHREKFMKELSKQGVVTSDDGDYDSDDEFSDDDEPLYTPSPGFDPKRKSLLLHVEQLVATSHSTRNIMAQEVHETKQLQDQVDTALDKNKRRLTLTKTVVDLLTSQLAGTRRKTLGNLEKESKWRKARQRVLGNIQVDKTRRMLDKLVREGASVLIVFPSTCPGTCLSACLSACLCACLSTYLHWYLPP